MSRPEDNQEELEQKPLLGHLEDLRWTILRCVAVLAVSVSVCLIFTKYIVDILQQPLIWIGKNPKDYTVTIGIIDPFSTHISIGMFSGLVLGLPFILYYLALFILPALTKEEKRHVLPVFAAGAMLFVFGVVFCYFFVVPKTLEFFLDYNTYMDTRAQWTFQNYVDFVIQMLIGFGLAFEMPLVLLILNYFGIISSHMLREYRRHAIVAIFVAACCITPSSDLFSLGMLAVPMYILYEACAIIMSWRESKIVQ
ncbi:MAG: twin-arginine translocase subunit TatC [Candidatus Methylacidiphilales bacterium]|nr:twin-arginine translocase subunit TatC [Candidatus Methylacidiphilales bacterium]